MSDQTSGGRESAAEVRAGFPGAAPESEWTVAAAAHASILVTVALGPAIGIGLLLGPVVVFAIYLAYRSRSDFVSRHAVQALVYQLAGGGALALLGGLGLSAVAAAWDLSETLARGGLLGPAQTLALPFTLFVGSSLLSIMLSWLVYGLYAALQVYQGRNYRYWLVGEWIARRSPTDRSP